MTDLHAEMNLRISALRETFPDMVFTITATHSNGALTIAQTPAQPGDDYDPEKDAHGSYLAAVEAKRLRGDETWPAAATEPDPA
ncbi:hypothetical protein LJR231_001530 [Phyllobacterium sp. LjRoot231]|uniref:hypothetical protein n=1 Tax=Phyllobacterium sp. LjRoot231 TaxID=3342289 RepID=UPI003ECF7BC9